MSYRIRRHTAATGRGQNGEITAAKSTERRAAERRGLRAEFWAALWLRLRGYRVLGRRLRTPVGEIDLLARSGSILVAVEVKARPSREAALSAVSLRQRRRIVRALDLIAVRDSRLAGLSRRLDLIAIRPWRLPWHLRDLHREQR